MRVEEGGGGCSNSDQNKSTGSQENRKEQFKIKNPREKTKPTDSCFSGDIAAYIGIAVRDKPLEFLKKTTFLIF